MTMGDRMRKQLATVPFLLLSGSVTAFAADCTVSGNTVNCGPGEVYVSANHGGKPLQDYATVTFHRTAANTHGYAQFSNQIVFQDVFITVEGSQSDGVTVRNWGPQVDFNNLSIRASGISGDGINVGRDNSNGQVRVHQNATIESVQGIGVRAVASEQDDKAHIITFNGNSTIKTYGNGGNDAGHAVFAGTQSKGCGPFGRPFFDCKANGRAEVNLLGDSDKLHTISTEGVVAHGLYASGKGTIVANNIQVQTQADNAHGLAVNRINDRFYYKSNDQGSQDYAGSIELRGNVAVTVQGANAYAFHADSGSELSGQDSEGKVASIRSFDSSLGTVVADKVYLVQGNMLATRSGLIDLHMGNGSQFTGTSAIDQNGVLNLQLAGPNSSWAMTGDSSLSSLTLADGARLRPQNANSPAPGNHTLTGTVNSQKGIIDLSQNALAGDTLTIDGDYIGDQGQILINSVLQDDQSVTDKLIITGNASGEGSLRVTNLGGTGAQTAQGIRVIEVQGQSGANFTLEGDYLHQGEQSVVAGAYAYKLRKGQVANAEGDWFLRSELKAIDPGPGPGPDPDPDPDPQPLYNAGAPINEVYPQLLLSLNTLPTLQQRLGQRYWSLTDSTLQGTASFSDDASPRALNGTWLRVEGEHSKMKPRQSTTDSRYDMDTFKLQLGLDRVVKETASGRLLAGASFLYGHGKADVSSPHGDGNIKTDSYGLAASLTWFAQQGFYVDGQAQYNWFDSKLHSSLAGKDLADGKNKGKGYALSLEAGQKLALSERWSLTPQAQVQYNKVDFDDFTTQWSSGNSEVSLKKGESVRARLGVSIDFQDTGENRQGQRTHSNFYGILNLYNEFSGKTKVRVSGTDLSHQQERLWASLGVGGAYSWDNNKYAIYGEGSVNSSVKHFGDSYGYKGTLGFRFRW